MIKKCPQLQVEVSKLNYPSLTFLSMKGVPFPILSIDEMGKVLGHASLGSLDIGGFPIPNYFSNPGRDDEIMLENIVCNHLSVGNNLEIENVQKLVFLPKWFNQVLTKVEKLSIRKCGELLMLWKNNGRLHHSLQGLRHLEIETCRQVVSLFEGEEYENKGHEQQQQLEVLPGLEFLSIKQCEKLEKLPQGLQNFMSLRDLIIHGCCNLVNFPEHNLPCTLRRLEIKQCDALRWLPTWNAQNSNLEELVVVCCESLEYLIPSSGGLPLTLKHLSINGCEKMFVLLQEEKGLVNLPCLEAFCISSCKSLKFLPDANLNNNNGSNNLKRLTGFMVCNCGNLEHIPQAWFLLPTNLTNLEINYCEKLLLKDVFSNASLTCLKGLLIGRGIEVSCLRENGNSLSNLTKLYIGNVNTGMPPSEWGLHRLSSLEFLFLCGPIVIVESELKQMEVDKKWSSFLFLGMLLPTSLTDLCIHDFKNLKALSSQFQHLTSLELLCIFHCPMLANFPKQGFPRSLFSLWINACPKLKETCQKGKGKYWPLINLLPDVMIS
ncbi:hypothetical protein NMG60_11029496 [Bertholletia excelsa]